MKRRTLSILAAGAAFFAGGTIALSAPTSPLDGLGKGRLAARTPGPRAVPKSLMEVEIAMKDLTERKRLLDEELAGIEERLTLLDGRVLARGRSYYKQVRAGLLPAGGGFEELVDHAANVEKNRLSLTRDLDESKALRRRREELLENQNRLEGELAPLEAQKTAFASAASAMRQADDRRSAFERAFSSSKEPSDAVVYAPLTGPADSSSQTLGFGALMGRVPFPLAGRAEVRRIERGAGPAVEFHAPGAATARSVYAGRVVFADQYENDGITVILDHGERFFTLYGNLTAISVKTGEQLRGGSPIGEVGERKGESVLIFELRKEGRAVDPAPWFGL